ncbi:hypothetical protein [Haladaptatus sp. DJG-WS-42]|uniref:hypothetical protein n=1 Tax=Haladaptatus sp. DJG-WS-42 TaxID=3120516 RepID=UPI0030D51090
MERTVLFHAALSVFVGLVAGFGSGLLVTAWLDPLVWPSVFVGLPVGATIAVATALATYAILARRAERRVDELTQRTATRMWAAVAGLAGIGVLALLAVGAVALGELGVGVGLLAFGFPLWYLVCVAGAFAFLGARRRTKRDQPRSL